MNVLITGSRKGIGRFLAEYYLRRGNTVFGCSREASDLEHVNYRHFCLDIADEKAVRKMFGEIRTSVQSLDALINNAGCASMNHCLLTPATSVDKVFATNVVGSFICAREAAKLMQTRNSGRIINFTSVAVPLRLEGESAYAASKSAVESLTRTLARELAPFGITVNAVGPTPVETDLISNVPKEKIQALLQRQAIQRFGKFEDVANLVDFFLKPESDFITGQIVYLGGVG